MNRFSLLGLAGAALLIALTACGTPQTPSPPSAPTAAAPTSSPFPPRPSELRLNGLNPCVLLTSAQERKLGVVATAPVQQPGGPGTTSCNWFSDEGPSNGWTAQTDVSKGAPATLDSSVPTQIVQVDGFSAIQGATPVGHPEGYCALFIDVAQSQYLAVAYDTDNNEIPGMNHQVACQQATKVATFMIQNLRALAR